MRQSIQTSRRWKPSTRVPFINLTRRYFRTSPSLQDRKRFSRSRVNNYVPFTVREFEQAGPDKKRLEFDPLAGLKREERLLKAKIEKLDNELQIMGEGPFGPNSEFMLSLPPKDREIALQAIKKHEDETSGDFDHTVGDAELEKLLEEEHTQRKKNHKADSAPKVQFRLEDKYFAYARGLNKALEKVAEDKDNLKNSAELWKWYLRCKMNLPHFTSQIEQDVWDALWASQLQAPECSRHLKLLAEDILTCGRELQDQQWLIYLDSLKVLGDLDLAIKKWQEARSKGTSLLQRSPNFWRLGAQLHVEANHLSQAESIACEAIEEKQGRSYRALLPVMSAWARDPSPQSRQKAWTCYLKVKAALGGELTMDDYDEISSSFLKAQKPDLALAVFKDMMISREKSPYNSATLYKSAVGYVNELRASSVTEEQVNSVSIAALTVLPKKFQNKFFYGKWIKKLIGLGEVDAAGAVVELMYERGVSPDTKHFNGIIGAWFRNENPNAEEKAERMSWAMIEKRIEYVNLRRRMSHEEAETALCKTPEGVMIPSFVRRMVPRANIETFSILLFQYVKRGAADTAQQLINHLSSAEIAPNAFILNQLLLLWRSKLDAGAVWTCYDRLKREVLPDLETFACLWDTAKLHFEQDRTQKAECFPLPRALFHEMQSWFRHMPHQSQRMIVSQFPHDLYELIMRCFSQGRNLYGTLCALHGMKQLFGCYPDDTITTMIMVQISRISLFKRGGRRRKKTGQVTTTTQGAIARIERLMREIESVRAVKLLEAGMDPSQLAEEPKGVKQIDVLTELLFQFFDKIIVDPSFDVQREVERWAESMGIACPDVPHLMRREMEVDSSQLRGAQ